MNARKNRAPRHRSAMPRPVCESLESRQLLSVTTLSNGAGDGAISVKVDAYGHYGSAAGSADDLTYDPAGASPARGTTYHSGVLFSPIGGYLAEGGIGSQAPVSFTSTSGTTAVSTFNVGGYAITLTQTLSARGAETSTFTQKYQVTNNTGAPQAFSMTRHVDGDMYFVGGLGNDFAGVSFDGKFVYEFDTATDPNAATAYFGISSAGDGTHTGWSIQRFPYYDDIDTANGIPTANLNRNYNDADNNRITDSGDDVTISLQDNFNVGVGQTVTYSTVTTFGTGSPLELVNPGIFSLAQPSHTVDEAAGTMTVTVNRLSGSAGAVTVNYALTGSSATPGQDFTGASGTLAFANGVRTATFTVTIIDDAIIELDEAFRVVLSNPTGGAQLSHTASAADVTITDNDATLQLAAPTFAIREDGGVLAVVVTRLGDTSGTGAVNYATADGTAQAGVDYTATTGTLTFAAGETTQTISVPVLTDALSLEPTETFTIALSGITGANHRPGTPMSAAVTLLNLDNVAPTAAVVVQGARNRISTLTVTFNETMAAASQGDPRGYTIWSRGIDGRNGAGRDRSYKVKSVAYDPATNTATVTPLRPLAPNIVYQLSLNSAFLTDPAGNRLDGNADGTGSDNYNLFFGRGSRLSYVDRDGDRVNLSVRGGGAIELLRDFDGEASRVSLVEDTGASQVSGLLRQTRGSGGTTSLNFVGRDSAKLFNGSQFIEA